MLVLLSPGLDSASQQGGGWRKLVRLFARDTTMRRTAVASGVGLAVTACVFFQPVRRSRFTHRTPQPPNRIVGA